jgi:hypothetical protein
LQRSRGREWRASRQIPVRKRAKEGKGKEEREVSDLQLSPPLGSTASKALDPILRRHCQPVLPIRAWTSFPSISLLVDSPFPVHFPQTTTNAILLPRPSHSPPSPPHPDTEQSRQTHLSCPVLDHLLRHQIVLVPDEQLVDALDGVSVDLLEPLLDVGKSVVVGDVVNDDDAVRASVIRGCDRSETFLAGGVPLRCVDHQRGRKEWEVKEGEWERVSVRSQGLG